MNKNLKISAFKDISAFLLTTLQSQTSINLDIKYVKNADEAHQDLKQNLAHIILMSYDDTLSIALEEQYSDILAILPIHGGMLDLCGEIDLQTNKNRIGIDTDSGYARALRLFLRHRYSPEDYGKLLFIKAGATNIRYEALRDNSLDVTLLNPPFSYQLNIHRDPEFQTFLGDYQGVVANTNKTFWHDYEYHQLLQSFTTDYYAMIKRIQNNYQESIESLANYYGISKPIATNIYNCLWQNNGLSTTYEFLDSHLRGTEAIFAQDTGIFIPSERHWLEQFHEH
ncbi:hypothetical protein [Synechocystis salina]|uniref:Uncharacterized protein n=1 Tax=Synechocystis salina LEGE 00031 TaxID=1828736 RepID=A0ABR9VPG3_9SYNC|nr:hypothetical protein [Synechocystis salina]MBE9241821.1 hypothetical protein [Synechocystis salina LEGE 00041]MBE9253259.1 hypothetical protein [Synechocystis salina LEGE 00031]